jgi:hypothetical protein
VSGKVERREFLALLGGAAVAWPLAAGAQPTAMRLVASLSRPGGNIAGVTLLVSELVPKRLE